MSTPVSELSSTFDASAAFFLSVVRSTAFLICRRPTLVAGSVAAAKAPPLWCDNQRERRGHARGCRAVQHHEDLLL
jgi:hypothetical protein